MNKHTIFVSVAVAAMVVGSYGARAADGAATADKSLSLAAAEAQSHIGGTVLEVDRNSGDPHEPYAAVVLSQKGVLHHFAFDLPVDQLWEQKPVTTADYTHTHDMDSVQVNLADAIRTAEGIAGAGANSAEFVASKEEHVSAYRVSFGGSSSPSQTVLIDARTGEQLKGTNYSDLST